MTVLATQIATAFPEGSAVVRVEWGVGRLSVIVEGTAEASRGVVLEFSDVVGFRVLDERDLMEFWPACSTSNGGLFEIHEGGWLSQERIRPGSCIGPMNPSVKEYLVTGPDDCVSVLSPNPPQVRECEV